MSISFTFLFYRNPGPGPQKATVARENCFLKGRKLEQDQTHLGGVLLRAGWVKKEEEEEGGNREDRIDKCIIHANALRHRAVQIGG